MKIQVLGSGCDRCHTLSRNARDAVRELGLDAQVEEVTDVAEIARRGIMATPALIVDDEVVLAGRVPSPAHVRDLLSKQPTG